MWHKNRSHYFGLSSFQIQVGAARRGEKKKVTSSYCRESLPLEVSKTGFLTRTSKRIIVTKEKKYVERGEKNNLTSNVLKVYNSTQTATEFTREISHSLAVSLSHLWGPPVACCVTPALHRQWPRTQHTLQKNLLLHVLIFF